MRSTVILCAVFVVMAGMSEVQAAWLSVNAFKYSDLSYETTVQVDLPDVAGVTDARAAGADGTAITLSPFGLQQFEARLGPFASFTGFHDATVGDWRLIVEFGSGNDAAYDFTVNDYRSPFTDSSFPPAPTVLSPLDGATDVEPTPTFLWNNGGAHTGTLESLFVSVRSDVNPAIGEFEGSTGGPISLNAETWTPSVVLPAGPASFLVQYETNESEDAHVSSPLFNPAFSTIADPGITWDQSAGDLFSRDLIGFTVVPEPSTLGLFLLCLPALWRRRRSGRQ